MHSRTRFFALPLVFSLTVFLWQPSQAQPAPQTQAIKAACEGSFEWYFLLVDTAKEQGLWLKHGLSREFVAAPGTAIQLKERVDAGAKVGFANTAEVTLARSNGVPVKTVALILVELSRNSTSRRMDR